MGRTASDYNSENKYAMGTTLAKFAARFQYGRTTAETCSYNTGLMPNPVDGCDGLSTVFEDNVYASTEDPWKYTAAISGAHTLGSANLITSGFEGFWSSAEEQGKFNNDYYKSLLLKGWMPQMAVNGVAGKNQWQRADISTLPHKEMMLDSDMCLAYQNNVQFETCKSAIPNGQSTQSCDQYRNDQVPLLAENGNCCAW